MSDGAQRIVDLIAKEAARQAAQLSLIASENHVSKPVLEALGSVFTNKYAEGYPGKRYYAGNGVADELERFVQEQARAAFATDYHVNVQPLSGSPANLAVYSALLQPGDTVLAMSLAHGGHLTHGHPVSLTGKIYNFVHYGVSRETELIDYDEVAALTKEHKPKLIVCGATAYPALLDFPRFARIAREAGAWLMADMAHIAGLVAGNAHPTPFGHADVITTTTHKTLRGPRGGLIFCRPEFAAAIDKAVFPGMQGGPHLHTMAAIGVALAEAQQPAFAQYAKQVVDNAAALAYYLQQRGYRLVTDGTECHLLLLDLAGTGIQGKEAQELLEEAGIICNKNMIPFDTASPMNPSGLRLGTPAVTTRGMKEKEMEALADAITAVLTSRRVDPAVSEQVAGLAKRFRIPAFP